MTWLARSGQSGRRQTVTGFGLILIVAALLLLTGSRCGSAQIRIAVAVTLSGPAANTGTETLAGIRLALEQAGPAARDVELAVIDDRGSVEQAREEAGRIAAGDAIAVIGPSLSTVGRAVDASYAEAGIAVVAPTIGTDETAGIFRFNLG